MGRVDRERCEDGKHAGVEDLDEVGAVVLVEVVPVREHDPDRFERGCDDRGEQRGLAPHQGANLIAYRRELFYGPEPVG